MDIDTGESLSMSQIPYNIELETLEKAGIIAPSVSPWVSPIVAVPKQI